MTRIMISAGEASGDLHAGALAREILRQDPGAEVYGMGGDCLRAAGGEVLFDIKDNNFMGFVEVVKHLDKIYALREQFRAVLLNRRPDCLVVIDYPDFNMRIAAMAKARGIPVISFISPSAWAWRKGRAKKVARIVDKVAAIFPFEYDVYKKAGADTEFVGHPLLDIVKPSLTREEAIRLCGKKEGRPLVMIMPGSRNKEIETMLPVMLAAARNLKARDANIDFVLPKAPTIPEKVLRDQLIVAGVQAPIVEGHIYDIMSVADVALATSGTVTLEAAICGLPTIICYKTAPLAYYLVKALINIKHIGLPNIVAGKTVVPELIQDDMTADNMRQEILRLLDADEYRRVRSELARVKERLGEPGAVARVAQMALTMAKEK